jgi:tetratricopeptide (TPR) repeat protein
MQEAVFQKRIGNNEGALQIYDKILEIDPENELNRFNRGNTLIALERYDEALDELLPIMEANPNNFMIRNNVAWIYATAKDIQIRDGQKAISLGRDALMLAPNDYQIWNTLSESYFVSARYEKALEIAEISFKMALQAQADNQTLESMAAQVRKCRHAVATMSIME